VKQTLRFLENLEKSMPFLQDLLEVFTQLDAFGIVAEILNDIGNALKPLLDILAPIASIIGDSLLLSIQELGVFIELILNLLQPWTILFEVLAQITQAVTERFAALLDELQPVLDVLSEIGKNILARLQPAIQRLIDKILELLPSPAEFARIIREDVLPAIEDFATWLENYGVDTITRLIDAIIGLIGWLTEDLPRSISSIKKWANDVSFYSQKVVQALKGPLFAIQAIIDIINRLNRTPLTPKGYSNVVVGGIPQAAGGINWNAEGGIANSLRWLNSGNIVGESGPEAIVPLMRALNQVDPSVRPLAAFAQGLVPEGWGGHRVTVEAGAIVVSGVSNPEAAAGAMLDRLVIRLGG
jgi:phage-related protein